MTLRDTAMVNKTNQEMKLWRESFITSRLNGSNISEATGNANLSVERFNEAFDEYGNII